MASSLASFMQIIARHDLTPASPNTGVVSAETVNATGGARWTQGTGSGQASRAKKISTSVAAAATNSYNLLAAGALTDALGQSIDLDELKFVVVKCLTGEIKFVGGATNTLGLFTDASKGIKLAAGHSIGVDFGAAGLDVTANSKFEITDTAGGAGSTYELHFGGAE